jgi:hypothetical protein
VPSVAVYHFVSPAPSHRSHDDAVGNAADPRDGDRSADEVFLGTISKAWWICSKDHEWEDTPNHRTSRGSGCPYCAGKRILIGFNDLAFTHGHLAIEWHPTRNGTLTPFDVVARLRS